MSEATNPTKGIAWLTEQVEAKLGEAMAPRELRIVIRKLVKDGEIERGEGRYEFSGLKDPQVVAIMKAIKSGAADAAKKERLQSLKASKGGDADEAPARKTRTRKAKVDDEPVEDEVPVKKPRARKGKAAAPVEDEAPAAKKPAARRRRAKAAPVSDDDDLDLDDI